MKSLLRNFLINLAALFGTTKLMPGLSYEEGIKTLILGTLALMFLNLLVLPLLKIMFLPLNLLTLGLFAWVINVVALYLLVTFLPQIKLMPYHFAGLSLAGVNIPSWDLNVLEVAIISSFLIGLISHSLQWLYSR